MDYSIKIQQEKFAQAIEQVSIIEPQIAKSQLTNLYQSLTQLIEFDQQKICDMCFRKGITYNPNSAYQPFQFEVKKINPFFNYYLVETKFAHFRMNITALKSENNLARNLYNVAKHNTNIYFANIDDQSLCFKTFYYSNQLEFQNIFNIMVKEFTILKICSAIECSLRVDNFLGFDIIIYDNCIQFAMEKGKELEYISKQQTIQLKKELRLMHQLRIIHYDIKPQNILFSQYFNKVVFIDFGFSEIVKQPYGFRTFTQFRGTPKFCSPQILQIMIIEKGYVDLYYNDAYSLNQVLKIIKKQSSTSFKQKELSAIIEDIQDMRSFSDEPKRSEQSSYVHNELDFIFLAFQFYYLNSNEIKSKDLLQKILIGSQRMAQKVLSFIKNILNYVFIPSIFFGELKEFQKLEEYQQIEALLKPSSVRFFLKKIVINNNQMANESFSYQPSSFVSGKNNCHQQYHQHKKMILKMETIEESFFQNFLSILYYCIRFNKRNLQLKDKLMIAEKAINLLSNYTYGIIDNLDLKNDKGLQRIKYLFYLIYRHCLRFKKGWCKNNIVNIFQQLILLDMDYQNLLDSLFEYLKQGIQTLQDLILVLLQVRKLCFACEMFTTQHYQKTQTIKRKFTIFIQKEERRISSFDQQVQIPQTLTMKKHYVGIFESNYERQKAIQLLDFFHKEIKTIKNYQFRKNILQYIIFRKIDFSFMFQGTQKVLELAKVVRYIINIQNINFLSYVRIMMKILCSISDFKGIKSFCSHVQTIINCPQMSKRLAPIIEVQKQQPNLNIILTKIPRLTRILNLNKMIDEQLQSELYQIYFRITSESIHIDDKLKHSLIQLYQQYQQCIRPFAKNPLITNFYYSVFCQSKVQFFFYNLDDKCRQAFLNTISQSQAELRMIDPSNHFALVSLQFKLLCNKFQLSSKEQQYQQFFVEIMKLFQLCKCLNMTFLAFQIFKEAISACYIYQKQSHLVYFIEELYQNCKQIKYYSFYLIQSNSFYAFLTLMVFARTNLNAFYEFINYLTSFVNANPIETYLQALFQVIDRFLKEQPYNSHLFHYQSFLPYPLKNNPNNLIFYVLSLKNQPYQTQLTLFKTICLHVNNLSSFMKRYLLKKYYCIFLDHLIEVDSQRKRFFIIKQAKFFLPYNRCLNQIRTFYQFQKAIAKSNAQISKRIKSKIDRLVKHLILYKEQEGIIEFGRVIF